MCWATSRLPPSCLPPRVPHELTNCRASPQVQSNPLLYKPGEHPDHCVVIKYVPYVGDSKRAMDEYTSEIFM